MRTAILGFGSLINNTYSPIYNKGLEVSRPEGAPPPSDEYKINADSPFVTAEGLRLPVQLGRVSGEGTDKRRITAVLMPNANDQQVFYAVSKLSTLDGAIKNLREREGISERNKQFIAYVNLRSGNSRSSMESVTDRVKTWAVANGFDAVVWTDLPHKGIPLEAYPEEILPLLAADHVLLANTCEYIRNLPTPPTDVQQIALSLGDELIRV